MKPSSDIFVLDRVARACVKVWFDLPEGVPPALLKMAADMLEHAVENLATAPVKNLADIVIKLQWLADAIDGNETAYEPELTRTALEGAERLAKEGAS